jgi:hypothetical protein
MSTIIEMCLGSYCIITTGIIVRIVYEFSLYEEKTEFFLLLLKGTIWKDQVRNSLDLSAVYIKIDLMTKQNVLFPKIGM